MIVCMIKNNLASLKQKPSNQKLTNYTVKQDFIFYKSKQNKNGGSAMLTLYYPDFLFDFTDIRCAWLIILGAFNWFYLLNQLDQCKRTISDLLLSNIYSPLLSYPDYYRDLSHQVFASSVSIKLKENCIVSVILNINEPMLFYMISHSR